MAYYNIKEYPIVIGNPDSGVALCVGWWDAGDLTDVHPALIEQCAIIGSLYLGNGINAMIRNLALNPGIRVVYLWRRDENSLSSKGIYATNTLLKLWREGVDALRMCDGFTLEKEIPVAIFDTIRDSVEIRVIDDVPESHLSRTVTYCTANPYMEAHSFPDPEYKVPMIFPSEQIGFVAHGETVYDAWLEALFHIYRFGSPHKNRDVLSKQVLSLTWVAKNETGAFPECAYMPEQLQRNLCVLPEQIAEYATNHFLQHAEVAPGSYTYGNRMHRWDGEFDQIEAAVSLLRENPATRQAYIAISVPDYDLLGNTQPPCMVGIHFLQDDNTLAALATFRSHDIFQAGLSNAFGIVYLLRSVAEKVGMQQGSVSITSHSAHIYFRDIDDASQLTNCVWGNKSIELTEKDMDPRGAFIVRVHNGKIVLDCINDAGQRLQRFSSTSADVLNRKIAPYHVTGPGQSGHACYLGIQLARAEECLRRGKEFTQDQPIPR